MGLFGEAAHAAIHALEETLHAVSQARPDMECPLPDFPQVHLASAQNSNTKGAGLDFDIVQEGLEHQITDQDLSYFNELKIGSWLDFIDKDEKIQSGKLSWISPISQRYLFVNRRGVRICVASVEELAMMHMLGRIRLHSEDDAFDNAIQSVINQLDGRNTTLH